VRRLLGVVIPVFLGLLGTGVAVTGAAAGNLFVHPTSSGSFCTQLSPCALGTALSQAQDGDFIFATAGTYTGSGDSVVTITKSIQILAGWDGSPSGVPARNRTTFVSVIDGENARRGVTIDGGLTVKLDGFTIVNGDASGLVADCSGTSGPAGGCGGGIFVYLATATISNCIIRNNIARTASAPPSTTGYGGGIYAAASGGLDIRNNTIEDNVGGAAGQAAGGGIYLMDCAGTSRVAGNVLSGNMANSEQFSAWGGGIAVTLGGVTVEGNVIESNRANASDGTYGGGVFVWYGSHAIGGNTIRGNFGAHAVYLGYFGGTFAANDVLANHAGTAVHLANGTSVGPALLVNNLIEGTDVDAVSANGSGTDPLVVTLKHNTIVGNGLTTGIFVDANSSVTLANNILFQHWTSINALPGAVVTGDHSLFWGNSSDPVRGANPIDGNPNFHNVLAHDYYLRPGSAAIDTGGDAGVDVDLEGHPRPLGSAPDVGAYEAPPSAFDFGTPTSPLAPGYTRVSPASVYASAAGFGWVQGTIGARDRVVGSALTRDLAFMRQGSFEVAAANGLYDVTVTLGDAAGPHDQMGIFLEGGQVDTVTTGKNQFLTRTYRVTVWDGFLTLKLQDLGGADPNAVINALVIRPSDTRKLDFGTSGSPVAPAFTRVTNATAYVPALGFGWQSGTVGSRDRGPAAGDLARDLNVTTAATFAVDLPANDYVVRVLSGDAERAHDLMQFRFEVPELGFDVSTASGQIKWGVADVTVSDGQLNVSLSDGGGGDPNVVINALDIEPRPALLFDFGAAGSPVALGYRQITPAEVYSAAAGWGWLEGTVEARNRASGSDLTRDFNFSHDATFAIDLPRRNCEVAITMGDATTRHELMGVYLEGELVDTVTTLANQFVTRTYIVAVTDGQLSLQLKDLGGGDPNAVINALAIR
jgi:fibronectin type 3 domain-containing protein